MATKVHMEALSPTMEEGQLVKWLKTEGDDVTEGDVLAEVETDKATMELVARGSGVLRKIGLSEGGTAPVGQLIGVIAEADEDIDSLLAELKSASPNGGPEAAHDKEREQVEEEAGEEEEEAGEEEEEAGEEEEEAGEEEATGEEEEVAGEEEEAAGEEEDEAEPSPRRTEKAAATKPREKEDEAEPSPGRTEKAAATKSREKEDEAEPSPGRTEKAAATKPREKEGAAAPGPDGRVKASPLARRLASESGIALESVSGSGPGGRIIRRDIEAAAASPRAAPAGEAGPEYEDVPVSQMRKTIAKRLVESIGPVPTFYLTIDVDMTRMLAARAVANRALESRGVKASINDFLIRAAAAALARHPEVNASWRGDAIRRHSRVHIGVAVAIEDGLITPVIRDANLKGVADIATEVRELAGRAREKKLKPDEYTGATFSISNLGMFGIEEFTAIINPPESCILAVGQVEERIVAIDGQPAVQPRMRMTLSCDHRVVDGATGARFLETLRGMVEEPGMMVV